MTSDSDADCARFWMLAKRYCELGRLLPPEADLDVADVKAVASAKLVLREMDKCEKEFRRVLARNALK